MANSAAGVLDRPARTTKVPSETQQKKTGASKRRGGNRIKEVSASSTSKARELGIRGEEAAARFLYHRGYEILERNYTCFAGEMDIIAKDGEAIVFVEVKTRARLQQGFPSEAVSSEKRDRFEKIALAYLSENDAEEVPIRFDTVSLVVIDKGRALVRHHISAFSVE